jgi:hypothetical protein
MKASRVVLWALLPAALALQLVAARHPAAVERGYSAGFYRHVASRLACLTAPLPFSLAEALLAALVLLLAWRVRRGLRPSRRGLMRALPTAGALYAGFLLSWGLNYSRRPFAETAGLELRPAAASELADLARALATAAEAERDGLGEDAEGVLRLADGRRGALARAAAGYARAAAAHPALAGRCSRPKPARLSPLLSVLGITGIYVPFTGEAHVNVQVPDPELPFTASHELAHQRGVAREDEANYVGYLACRVHPDRDFRYSGLLAAASYALSALAAAERGAFRDVAAGLGPGVRRDLAAIERWAARHAGPVRDAARRVNDAYLRSQGQREGVRSYGRLVDLLLAERRAGRGPAAPPGGAPLTSRSSS